MSFASSYLLQSHLSSSSSLSQSVCLFLKQNNAEYKKKKRAIAPASCMHRQEEPELNNVVFSRKKAVLFVGISVLPFLQLRARALEDFIAEENALKMLEKNQKTEQGVQTSSSNPFVTLLNGLGIFATGILGGLYALAQKEKKSTSVTIESMTAKLKEKEDAFEALEKDFESKLLREQEERMKQLRKAREEHQVLMNQLNSANVTISGLGQELKNEKQLMEELKVQIGILETNLSKAGEEKKALEQELKQKLNSIQALQDKINLLSLELKDKEDNVKNLSLSLAKNELELTDLNSTYKQAKDELGEAHTEIQELEAEILRNKDELESKISVVDGLNSTVRSLIIERDDSNQKLNAIQDNYSVMKCSYEKKAALDAKLLGEREEELHQLKEKLELALNEVSGNQAIIADLIHEREDLRKTLDIELSSVKNLKDELRNTQEALGKSRNEASDLAEQLMQSRNRSSELEAELFKVQSEFAETTKTLQKNLDMTKQSGELLASELTAVKEQLKRTKEELQIMSQELAAVTENHDSIQEELVDVYKKAEVTANELIQEKNAVSSLNKELENLEKQILKDKEARISLEMDLEEATKSLDEMNRNALILSRDLEMANSRISSLEDEKEVFYKSLTEQKNASKEARENLEDAHNIVLRLGKERESLERKAKKLEEELASAKGEILRLRSQLNSSKSLVNDQQLQKDGTQEKVTVDAKRTTRRRRSSSQ